MATNTKIEWTDHTFNPWIGCTKVASGCEHCYAEAQMDSRLGKAKWGPSGTRVKTSEANWRKPLKWNRDAEKAGERRRVFCASLADVFEDWQGPIHGSGFDDGVLSIDHMRTRELTMADLRRDLFALIDATPCLDWILLTKRPVNILRMWPDCNVETNSQPHSDGRDNVWLVTSIATQADADRDIPLLLECRDLVPVLGVSAEPLLGQVALSSQLSALDWVIVGGESGPNARPCHLDWCRDLVRQCQDAKVPCFVKQLGTNHHALNPETETIERVPLEDTKGGDPSEWPEYLRVRKFPETVHHGVTEGTE